MKRVCVFCGSSTGALPEYRDAAARQLGTRLTEREIGVVYDGASVGLMGDVANAALETQIENLSTLNEELLSAIKRLEGEHVRRIAEGGDSFGPGESPL